MFPNPQDAVPLPAHAEIARYERLADERGTRPIDEWVAELAAEPAAQQRIADFARREPDARVVIARSYGFPTWAAFAAVVSAARDPSSPEARFERAADSIATGDLATLRRLLHDDPALALRRSTREHGATLLHYTSANGVEGYRQRTPKNIVELTAALLDASAEIDAEANVYGGGCTTLELAATSCHPEDAGVQEPLLQLLLERGASLGSGIVVACLANGRKRAAEYLASRGAPLDLEGAAGVGRMDLVDQLLPAATDQQRRDALLWACQFGREAVVDLLLDRGVSATGAGHRGITALHWAAYAGNANIVRVLLARGAPVDVVEPSFDGTPLDWALHARDQERRTGDHDDVIAQLVRAGAVRR